MINRACRTELKEPKRRRNIAAMVMGTTMAKRFIARCWFSNCPPQDMKYPGGNLMAASMFDWGFLDETANVASDHIAFDNNAALGHLAADLRRAFRYIDLGELAQRNQRPLVERR